MSGDKDGTVTVEVYSDELSAVVFIIPPEGNGRPADLSEVKRALWGAGVVHGVESDESILAVLEKGKDMPSDILLIGTEPTEGTDAEVKFLWQEKTSEEEEEEEGDGAARFEARFLETVAKGEVIARKKPATDGKSGITVTGKTIPGGKGADIPLEAGSNVAVSEDGIEFTAAQDGIPRFADGVLSVAPVHVVDGDIDASTGNVNFAGALEVRGSVREGYVVKAEGSVIIRQDILGEEVTSGGDIIVMGSIVTQNGLVAAGGSVCAELIKNSVVEAGEDVVVSTGIINSRVRSNGMVACASGGSRIAGGEITAYRAISAKELGTDDGTSTILRSGLKYETYKKLMELEKLQEKVGLEIARIQKSTASPRVGQAEIVNLKNFLDKLHAARLKIQQNIDALTSSLKVNPAAIIKGEDAISPGCVVYIGFVERKIVKTLRRALFCADAGGGMRVAYYDGVSDTMKSFTMQPKKK